MTNEYPQQQTLEIGKLYRTIGLPSAMWRDEIVNYDVSIGCHEILLYLGEGICQDKERWHRNYTIHRFLGPKGKIYWRFDPSECIEEIAMVY